MLLSLILGDGCLHLTSHKVSGSITIDHGLKQADYQSWKADLLSKLTGRNVKMRNGHKGKSVQVSVCFKRFKAWRKIFYKDRKKDIPKILKFINNPSFALTVWLLDDGYVESSINNGKNGGARFRLFINQCNADQAEFIKNWINSNFNINVKVKWMKDKGKQVPFIKFNGKDSLKIWSNIREFVLQFKSMQYKFRYIEQIYQLKCLQNPAPNKVKI